jgi:hypothetical protein
VPKLTSLAVTTDWVRLWRDGVLRDVIHDRSWSLRVTDALNGEAPEALRPVADRGLALHDAGRPEGDGIVPVACYAALCHRAGVPVPARFHAILIERANRLRYVGLLAIAGEGLRACPDDAVDTLEHLPFPPVVLLGHIGGAERAARFVERVRAWPRGIYTQWRKQAIADGRRRDFERAYGYDKSEFVEMWTAGLAAFGADAVEPVTAALETGTAHEPMLREVLARVQAATAQPR